MTLHEVLITPIRTEKSEQLKESLRGVSRYSFYVHKKANKELVRQALHHLYKVKVTKVNILIEAGKQKRFRQDKYKQSGLKKAIVTLARGHSLDLLSKGS